MNEWLGHFFNQSRLNFGELFQWLYMAPVDFVFKQTSFWKVKGCDLVIADLFLTFFDITALRSTCFTSYRGSVSHSCVVFMFVFIKLQWSFCCSNSSLENCGNAWMNIFGATDCTLLHVRASFTDHFPSLSHKHCHFINLQVFSQSHLNLVSCLLWGVYNLHILQSRGIDVFHRHMAH